MQPHSKYKNAGWKGLGDWLGTGRVASNLRKVFSYDEARSYANKLGFKFSKDWKQHVRDLGYLEHLTVFPDNTYKDKGWVNWEEFLGKSYLGRIENKQKKK